MENDKDKEDGPNTEAAEAPAQAQASSSSSTNKAAAEEAPKLPPTEHGQAKDDTSAAAAEATPASRIIYGKDVPNESDEIQYKWGAIFYNYSPAQRALLALDEVSMYSITDTRSANNTSRILQQLVGDRAVITDGCAAAGGTSCRSPSTSAKSRLWNSTRSGIACLNTMSRHWD